MAKARVAYSNRRTNQPTGKDDISRQHALSILAESISSEHICESIFELATKACRKHQIPLNDYLCRQGLHAALAAVNREARPDVPEDGCVIGELSSRYQLFRLWDMSLSPFGFEEWLKQRHDCKRDCFKLGLILGKDFHEQPHGAWRDFLPSFNPDTLKPGYSQEEMKQWLASQVSHIESWKRDFLQLCSRNSYKSSFSLVWALTAVLCCPDIRLLLCSETTKLSKAFIKSFRAYWERHSGAQNEAFHQLFPEYLIPAESGSVLSFESPMAHLNLPQVTAEVTSLESSSTGSRFDIGIFDDPISNMNTGNEEMRESGLAKYDALQKLKEVGGISLTIGTPWHPADLYATLMKRNEDQQTLAVRIDPAWRVKPEVEKKDIHLLEESDVELMFPERLTFTFLKKELGTTKQQERFFRMQNLCQFVPDEEAELKLNFSRDLLTRAVLPLGSAPVVGDTILSCDTSFSTAKYADVSALSVLRVYTDPITKETAVAVMWQESGRYRGTELGAILARLNSTWKPRIVLIERPPNADLLEAEIRKQSMRYEMSMPLMFVTPENSKNAKYHRIKGLELLIPDKLKFAGTGWNIDGLFDQLVNLSDGPYKFSRHNDLADSIGLGIKFLRVLGQRSEPENDEESKKRLQEALRQGVYNWIHNTPGQPKHVPPPAPEPTEPVDPRRGILGEYGRRLLGPGFRV